MASVSVVIPLYNKATLVERAVRSVLRQTFQDLEMVVVNDGSTDDGPALVAAMDDPRIRIIHQANAGVSAARNRGIAQAQATLIAFLDADDEWTPGFLSTIMRLKSAFPECGAFATNYIVRYDSRMQCAGDQYGSRPDGPEGILDDYFRLASRLEVSVWTSAVAVTKDAITSIGAFPVGVPVGEDLLTWARIAARYNIAYSPRPLSIYHRRPPNPVLSRRPTYPDIVAQGLARLAEEATVNRKSIRGYVGLWHKMRAWLQLLYGQPRAAFRELRLALSYGYVTPGVIGLCVVAAMPGPIRRAVFLRRYGMAPDRGRAAGSTSSAGRAVR